MVLEQKDDTDRLVKKAGRRPERHRDDFRGERRSSGRRYSNGHRFQTQKQNYHVNKVLGTIQPILSYIKYCLQAQQFPKIRPVQKTVENSPEPVSSCSPQWGQPPSPIRTRDSQARVEQNILAKETREYSYSDVRPRGTSPVLNALVDNFSNLNIR